MNRMLAIGTVLAATVVGGCASPKPVAHGEKDMSGLAELKALEGTWMMRDEKGQEQVGLVTKVIAGGSVVHETMFPGSPHEMVNTYHLDNGQIVVTHYCAAGNQPRMACRGGKNGVFAFTLRDITNRGSRAESYMGALTVTIKDKNHLVQDWASFSDGKRTEGPRFELVRKGS
ncbi:MAG: hypothetical protein DYG92_10110 [Leptolyngbya sp. PLA1]|nr:hypothetical protein [Leptolyngbya sp. PLA1]